LKIFALH